MKPLPRVDYTFELVDAPRFGDLRRVLPVNVVCTYRWHDGKRSRSRRVDPTTATRLLALHNLAGIRWTWTADPVTPSKENPDGAVG